MHGPSPVLATALRSIVPRAQSGYSMRPSFRLSVAASSNDPYVHLNTGYGMSLGREAPGPAASLMVETLCLWLRQRTLMWLPRQMDAPV